MKEFKIKTMEIFVIIMSYLITFSFGWKLSYDINFKHSENTEGVSNDTDESGVLHGVGDSHVSEPTDKDNQSFVDGTLEIRTDGENECKHSYRFNYRKARRECVKCKKRWRKSFMYPA
jgi:hypothetical protein